MASPYRRGGVALNRHVRLLPRLINRHQQQQQQQQHQTRSGGTHSKTTRSSLSCCLLISNKKKQKKRKKPTSSVWSRVLCRRRLIGSSPWPLFRVVHHRATLIRRHHRKLRPLRPHPAAVAPPPPHPSRMQITSPGGGGGVEECEGVGGWLARSHRPSINEPPNSKRSAPNPTPTLRINHPPDRSKNNNNNSTNIENIDNFNYNNETRETIGKNEPKFEWFSLIAVL